MIHRLEGDGWVWICDGYGLGFGSGVWVWVEIRWVDKRGEVKIEFFFSCAA